MVRFLMRMIGFVLMAAAFALLIVDGTRMLAARHGVMFSLGETLDWLLPARMAELSALTSRGPRIGRVALAGAMALPACLVTAAGAVVFLLAGRRPPKGIGFTGEE